MGLIAVFSGLILNLGPYVWHPWYGETRTSLQALVPVCLGSPGSDLGSFPVCFKRSHKTHSAPEQRNRIQVQFCFPSVARLCASLPFIEQKAHFWTCTDMTQRRDERVRSWLPWCFYSDSWNINSSVCWQLAGYWGDCGPRRCVCVRYCIHKVCG